MSDRSAASGDEVSGAIEAADERAQLLNRVAASPPFQKSNRLRELLLFLGERALHAPGAPVREQDIGVHVFGRPPGYDTSQDTLVRVHACQLRKELQQYFAEDGRNEHLLIEVPKGSYLPVFRVREAASAPEGERTPAKSGRPWMPWIAAGLLAVLSAALLFQNLRLRGDAELGLARAPTVTRFWQRALDNGLHTALVVSDANLVVFEDAIGRHLTIQEYQSKAFESLAKERIADSALRTLMLNLVGRVYTGNSDAAAIRKLTLACAAGGLHLDLVNAREISAAQITVQNGILLGSRRANPWVNLFEPMLNFQAGFEESPRAAYFANRSPKPGEEAAYRGAFGRFGYCRLAFLPNLTGKGSVVLITGTDIASTDAGGEFLTSEAWMRVLGNALGVKDSEDFPYFEALIRGQVVNKTVPQFAFVTARRH